MSTPYNPYENNNADNLGNGLENGGGAYNAASNPNGFPQGNAPLGSRKLHRSINDRMIGGVAGGIAETYDLDPTLVRIIFVALAVLALSGVLLYIICWIVIPDMSY